MAQLNFHLNVQKTALNEATSLATRIRRLLQLDTAPEPDGRPVCSIDMDSISPDQAHALPCGHVFHNDCINLWLAHSNTCPLDRTIVYPEESEDDSNATQRGDDEDEIGNDNLANERTEDPNIAESSAADRVLIDQLAFHHRLIAELELLIARAEELAAEGTEAELNLQWTDFLRAQIARLCEKATELEDEILGSDDEAAAE